jgi:hypothetical protein
MHDATVPLPHDVRPHGAVGAGPAAGPHAATTTTADTIRLRMAGGHDQRSVKTTAVRNVRAGFQFK